MPDITMCTGGNCPQKKTCWRHIATPSEYRQSYFVIPPFEEEKGCEYYSEATISRCYKRPNDYLDDLDRNATLQDGREERD